jgi:TetR/AcrR family transcriptional repressor of nem operon
MPRPKEFDNNTALDAAIEVFRRQGYEAASVQDLLDAMGINRGSLYDSFGNKHSLFLAALDRYDQRRYEEVCAVLKRYDGDTVVTLFERYYRQIIGLAIPSHRDPFGCLMTNSSMALASSDPAIATRATRNWARMECVLLEALMEARRHGEIQGDERRLRSLARYLLGVGKGLRVAAKYPCDQETLEDIAKIALETLAQNGEAAGSSVS